MSREDTPSMYLYELVNWLTTVVDSLDITETYKDDAYKIALSYIADCLMVSTSSLLTPLNPINDLLGSPDREGYTNDERKCFIQYPGGRELP